MSLDPDGSGTSSATVIGGRDKLFGGSGDDTLYGEGTVLGSSTAVLEGSGDQLFGGSGNDTLWGDGTAEASTPEDASLAGGADVFVFDTTDGRDTVMDFRRSDGDRLDLRGTGLDWTRFDSNGNGALDGADRFVTVSDGALRLDLGQAAGASGPGLNVVALMGVETLREIDLLFL